MVTEIKVKVQIYSLVSSTKRHSPDFSQLPLGHRSYLFISHTNFPGRLEPDSHFRRTELLKHTSLHCPTRYPLTPGSRECTHEQSAFPRSTTSEHIQRSRGTEPAISCLYVAHAITEPRRPAKKEMALCSGPCHAMERQVETVDLDQRAYECAFLYDDIRSVCCVCLYPLMPKVGAELSSSKPNEIICRTSVQQLFNMLRLF